MPIFPLSVSSTVPFSLQPSPEGGAGVIWLAFHSHHHQVTDDAVGLELSARGGHMERFVLPLFLRFLGNAAYSPFSSTSFERFSSCTWARHLSSTEGPKMSPTGSASLCARSASANVERNTGQKAHVNKCMN